MCKSYLMYLKCYSTKYTWNHCVVGIETARLHFQHRTHTHSHTHNRSWWFDIKGTLPLPGLFFFSVSRIIECSEDNTENCFHFVLWSACSWAYVQIFYMQYTLEFGYGYLHAAKCSDSISIWWASKNWPQSFALSSSIVYKLPQFESKSHKKSPQNWQFLGFFLAVIPGCYFL